MLIEYLPLEVAEESIVDINLLAEFLPLEVAGVAEADVNLLTPSLKFSPSDVNYTNHELSSLCLEMGKMQNSTDAMCMILIRTV